jgi:uncharacterized protein (TIGR03437 family)
VSARAAPRELFGGTVAVQVLYAGSAPTLAAGVAQINLQLPTTAPTGAIFLILNLGESISGYKTSGGIFTSN